jgi:predicted nucleic acid-binding protein
MAGDTLGPAGWVVVALGRGPATAGRLAGALRRLGRPVGPASLIAALARLERESVVVRDASCRPPMYRLAIYHDEGI